MTIPCLCEIDFLQDIIYPEDNLDRIISGDYEDILPIDPEFGVEPPHIELPIANVD